MKLQELCDSKTHTSHTHSRQSSKHQAGCVLPTRCGNSIADFDDEQRMHCSKIDIEIKRSSRIN